MQLYLEFHSNQNMYCFELKDFNLQNVWALLYLAMNPKGKHLQLMVCILRNPALLIDNFM